MRTLGASILAGLCALAAPAVWCGAQETTQTVTLDPERAKGRLITPAAAKAAELVNGNRYQLRISKTSGTVTLAGQSVAMRVDRKGRTYYLGVDVDGDGSVSSKEFRRMTISRGRPQPMAFTVKAGGTEIAVVLIDLTMPVVSKTSVSMSANILPAACMMGQYAGQTVRIVDDNLDGQITQDGKDALIVGQCVGVPLMKRHALGKHHVEMTVSPDGKTMELSPLPADTQIGLVKLPLKSTMVKALVLTSTQGSYDIAGLPAGVGVPPGDYKLTYGAVADKRSSLLMVPGKEAVTYAIQGGKINTLRIGAPLKVNFFFRASGETLNVSAYPVEIIGVGGEVYTPIDYGTGGNSSLPEVLVTGGSGNRQMDRGSMEYG